MRFLITGGAGFIEKHLARQLRERDPKVAIFGNYDALVPGKARCDGRQDILDSGGPGELVELAHGVQEGDRLPRAHKELSVRGLV